MKARFKRTKTSDGLPLLAGKMYSVLDVKCGRDGAIEKIRVKNEKGEKEWYKANKFLLLVDSRHISTDLFLKWLTEWLKHGEKRKGESKCTEI